MKSKKARRIRLFQDLQKNSPPRWKTYFVSKFVPLDSIAGGLGLSFINFIGTLIILTVPYWIGRASGIDAVQKLVKKYPKFGVILDRQQNSSFFLCFFLRIISCLPGDIVTMYLGATKTPFWQNLAAGCIGILPGMVLATLMGESIRNPRSPQFWISTGLIVASSILSVLLYYIYRRRLQKKVDGK